MWLATGLDRASPPAERPPLTSSASALPSIADAVREALSMLQPLLPLGELLTLHGMGQGRRAPVRAASAPDAAYEEREQLRRLKETHDALLKQASSKPRFTKGTQAAAAAAAAAATTNSACTAASNSECGDTAATAAAAAALMAVASCASNNNTAQQDVPPRFFPTDPGGCPHLVRAQQAQQTQLDKFAAFHGAMHTPDAAELLARVTAEVEVRPSGGTVGVFATRDLDAATFRCPYPGWLMSHALHDELHARFHIPTAVQLQQPQQRHILVGDPGALGCAIQTRAAESNMTFAWEEMPRRQATHSAAAPLFLCMRPTRDIAAGEELLLDRGDACWQHADGDNGAPEHHCQVCFARECSAFNEMFVCEGVLPNGQPCLVGQHEHCFPNATALPNKRSARSRWFCEAHTLKQRRR
jgi:hypothetical protein